MLYKLFNIFNIIFKDLDTLKFLFLPYLNAHERGNVSDISLIYAFIEFMFREFVCV